MDQNRIENQVEFTDEGRLVVELSRTILVGDVDGAFRILGAHMDSQGLKVSETVMAEFSEAGRVA